MLSSQEIPLALCEGVREGNNASEVKERKLLNCIKYMAVTGALPSRGQTLAMHIWERGKRGQLFVLKEEAIKVIDLS